MQNWVPERGSSGLIDENSKSKLLSVIQLMLISCSFLSQLFCIVYIQVQTILTLKIVHKNLW